MTKSEFMARLREFNPAAPEISGEDYAIVEFVYTWHRAIPEHGGKECIANLYHLCGMPIIRDMCESAKQEALRRLNRQIAEIHNVNPNMGNVRTGMDNVHSSGGGIGSSISISQTQLSDFYAHLVRTLTEYEEGNATALDLYSLLCDVQNAICERST